jgi:hypothetical protein
MNPTSTPSGTTVVAMVLIGAFAIDRIVTILLFLFELSPGWRLRHPDPRTLAEPQRSDAERSQKVRYFALAIPIGLLAVRSFKPRLLEAIGIQASDGLNWLFSLLVLVGGADRITELLGSSAKDRARESAEAPIKVEGTLTLVSGEHVRAGGS